MAQLRDLLSLMASLDRSSSKGELLGDTSQTVQLLIPVPFFHLGCPLSFFCFWLSPSHPPSLGSDVPSLSFSTPSLPFHSSHQTLCACVCRIPALTPRNCTGLGVCLSPPDLGPLTLCLWTWQSAVYGVGRQCLSVE